MNWARRLVFCCVGLDWQLICPLISLALLTRSHPPPHPHPNQQLVSPRLNVRCEATWRTRRKHGQRRRRALAILLRKWRRSRRSYGRPTSKPPVSTLATTRHVGRTGGAWPINLVPHNPCTHTPLFPPFNRMGRRGVRQTARRRSCGRISPRRSRRSPGCRPLSTWPLTTLRATSSASRPPWPAPTRARPRRPIFAASSNGLRWVSGVVFMNVGCTPRCCGLGLRNI